MKLIFACIALAAFAQGNDMEEIEKFISQTTNNCCEQQGVSSRRMQALMDKNQLPEDDQEFITFYDCLMFGLNMYDKNDEVHFERLGGALPDYLVTRFDSRLDVNLVQETFAYCNRKHKTTPRALEAIQRRNCGYVYVYNKLNRN